MILHEEKVLRINCPGFGVSSVLPLGEAKPLAMYDVIIVNPVSILHLFETKSTFLQQIDTWQSDGLTSYRTDDDNLLQSLTAELELRRQELDQFIKRGGLLIYFLAPPFTISGPSITMDNYSWLNEWIPDKPQESNSRNMSATIRGKAMDITIEGSSSIFNSYLKQQNLEWSTIIRLENLSNNYVCLATAGTNKCVAGSCETGFKAGKVAFLPAPFDPAFDPSLKDVLEQWYEMYLQYTDEKTLSPSASSKSVDTSKVAKAAATSTSESSLLQNLFTADKAAAPDLTEPKTTKPSPETESNGEVSPEPLSNALAQDSPPKAKDTPRKMEQEIPRLPVPSWCAKYSFHELDQLRQQHHDLNEEVRLSQIKITNLEDRIRIMEDLKNSLLASDSMELASACQKVFEQLGWQTQAAPNSCDELWLLDKNKTQAVVRLIHTTAQPQRADLARLAESVINYWGTHEVEPKGILVASTFADRPPSERNEEDFPEAMVDFAKRKNLCLLTTIQLLSIYRDLVVNGIAASQIKEGLLSTTGRITGYKIDFSGGSSSATTVKKVLR